MKNYDAYSKTPHNDYKPERPNHVRTAFKTLFFLLIYHAVSWLFYTIFLANSVEVLMVRDELGARIWWTMFAFSAVTLTIIGVVMAIFYLKNGDRKRAFLAATSEEVRGSREQVAEGVARYRRLALVEGLICTLATGALWMIPAVFYSVSLSTAGIGFGYASAWGLEKFFVGFMGLCEPFQNPWLGMLIGLGILFVFQYFGRLYAHKKWQENRIRR